MSLVRTTPIICTMGWTVDTPHGQLYGLYVEYGWASVDRCTALSVHWAVPGPVQHRLPMTGHWQLLSQSWKICQPPHWPAVHPVTWHQEHENCGRGSHTLFTVFTFRGDFNAGKAIICNYSEGPIEKVKNGPTGQIVSQVVQPRIGHCPLEIVPRG